MTEILRREIVLHCSARHAFRVFTDRVDLWWPRGHRRNPDSKLAFGDGRLIESGPDGSDWVMARVTACEPPTRLALDWFPGSPAAPTHVEIAFVEAGDRTTISIVHQPLTVAAEEIWPQRIALFTRGWEAVLAALKSEAEQTKGD